MNGGEGREAFNNIYYWTVLICLHVYGPKFTWEGLHLIVYSIIIFDTIFGLDAE